MLKTIPEFISISISKTILEFNPDFNIISITIHKLNVISISMFNPICHGWVGEGGGGGGGGHDAKALTEDFHFKVIDSCQGFCKVPL